MPRYRCASFFAGVGGIDIGFEGFGNNRSDTFDIVYANEILEVKCKNTYHINKRTHTLKYVQVLLFIC